MCRSYQESIGFGFRRFLAVDDMNMCSEFSTMNSVVMASAQGTIKTPINAPAHGKKRSQIDEFVQFYGVQHIAFRTSDILTAVRNLKARGVEFIQVPSTYYDDIRARFHRCPMKLEEDMNDLQSLISSLISMKVVICSRFSQSHCRIDQRCSLRSLNAIILMAPAPAISKPYLRQSNESSRKRAIEVRKFVIHRAKLSAIGKRWDWREI